MNNKINQYRTFDEMVADRFNAHPEEIEGFLQTVLEEYEKDPDESALLSALNQIVNTESGMATLAEKTNLSAEDLHEILSSEGNPRIKNLRVILQAFGYTLCFKPNSLIHH